MNEITCPVCHGYVPGHATGAGDICSCEPIYTGSKNAVVEEESIQKGFLEQLWDRGVGLQQGHRRPTLDAIAHRENVPELWSDKRSPTPGRPEFVGHDYLRLYEREFFPLRDAPIRLMEIGLNVGASIKLWLEYFTSAQIVGIDISDFQSKVGEPDPQRFTFVKGDQFSVNFWNEFKAKYPEPFDVIIDDGSHASGPIETSFACMWCKIKPGGLYIVEDLGEVNNPASHTPGYKNQTDWTKSLVEAALSGELEIDELHISKELCMIRKNQ